MSESRKKKYERSLKIEQGVRFRPKRIGGTYYVQSSYPVLGRYLTVFNSFKDKSEAILFKSIMRELRKIERRSYYVKSTANLRKDADGKIIRRKDYKKQPTAKKLSGSEGKENLY